MVTLKEWFNPAKVITTMGALKFGTSLFKDETRYPHWEMDQALKLYENRPQINSGIRQYAHFLMGDGVIAKCDDDEASKEYLQTWIDQRKGFQTEVFNFIIMALVTGNPYFEPSYVKAKNGTTIVDNLFNIHDPSRIYYNLDHRKTDDEYWLYEIPIEVKVFPFQGQEYRPKYYRINYIRGSILFQRLVYAIPVHKSKLRHFKFGWSRDGIYGRSFLASCIDDGEIVFEILKNLAIISRTRALNTKLISIGSEKNKATIEDLNAFDSNLKNRNEEEHILINKPVSELNFSHQGHYDKMETSIDWLRKDIGSGLVPNFITPWNNEINRATAGETKIPFQLELKAVAEELIRALNKIIIESLRQIKPDLSQDLTFDFPVVDMTSQEEKMLYAGQMFRDNVMTLNEYRISAGYDKVEDGDLWAFQLPTLPVDQMTQTVKHEDQDVDMETPAVMKPANGNGNGNIQLPVDQQRIQMQSWHKIPSTKLVPKNKKKKVKTKFSENPTFTERKVANGVKVKDDKVIDMADVYTELFDTAKEIEQAMKKLKMGSLIKTSSDRGRKLARLQKGDKKSVIDIIKDSLDKNLQMKKTSADFKQDIKDAIQTYKDGEPQYTDVAVDRIARTELSRMREAGKLIKFKQEGFTKVEHITRMDNVTGDKDRKLNGKKLDIDYLLSPASERNNDRIPIHPNCRCTYIPYD